MAEQGEEVIPSVKDLASSDPKLRTASFKTIQEDLKARQSLTYTQALQLWKGLFYLLYLTPSHPPLPHQRVVISVANLTSQVSTPSSSTLVPLTTAFWETIVREWSSIDSHRMDKYLLLIRFVIRNMFLNILTLHILSETTQGSPLTPGNTRDDLVKVFSQWPLTTPGPESHYSKVSEGLRYHVLDCWVAEIQTAWTTIAENEDKPKGDKIFGESREMLMEPIRRLGEGKGVSKGMRKRTKETLEDESLTEWMSGD